MENNYFEFSSQHCGVIIPYNMVSGVYMYKDFFIIGVIGDESGPKCTNYDQLEAYKKWLTSS